MNRAAFSVTQVDNGFIVRVKHTGSDLLKEPYRKPVMVFRTIDDLIMYARNFFFEKEETI